MRPADFVQVAKNVCLDFELLSSGLHHKIAVCQLGAPERRLNAFQCRRFFLGSDLVLRNFALEILGNRLQRAIQKALLHITQHNLVSAAGKNMSDAIAHCSGAHHSHAFYIHDDFSSAGKKGSMKV